jgi:hypothetical protein
MFGSMSLLKSFAVAASAGLATASMQQLLLSHTSASSSPLASPPAAILGLFVERDIVAVLV